MLSFYSRPGLQRRNTTLSTGLLLLITMTSSACSANSNDVDGSAPTGEIRVDLGDRPLYLLSLLPAGDLKTRLSQCDISSVETQAFSIAHRGAPFRFPEHTDEGYRAAAAMGAGVIECDATFTKDRELVCRHSQCDLHTTTDILATPLASQCRRPPDFTSNTPFTNVECCTSDITLAEFRTLRGKRDGGDKSANSIEDFLAATPAWRFDDSVDYATLMTHDESITLFKELGVSMTPELKEALVTMPYEGDYTQADYAQQMIDEYIAAGIDPQRVFPQSFNLEDIHHWQQAAPEFARQAVWLDGRYREATFDSNNAASWQPDMQQLANDDVPYLAAPLWMLLTLNDQQQIVPSNYARAARAAGLRLIAWTLERSGSLSAGDNWYYQTIQPAIDNDGDMLTVLDVLARDVGVEAVFSDWPATTSYYAHCARVSTDDNQP